MSLKNILLITASIFVVFSCGYLGSSELEIIEARKARQLKLINDAEIAADLEIRSHLIPEER